MEKNYLRVCRHFYSFPCMVCPIFSCSSSFLNGFFSRLISWKLNSFIYVVLFYFRFLYSAVSNCLCKDSKLGGFLALITLWARSFFFTDSKFLRASFYWKSFSILGGSLALFKLYWAIRAIFSFRYTYCSSFFLSKSTEQNHGVGLALNWNSSLSYFDFFGAFRL